MKKKYILYSALVVVVLLWGFLLFNRQDKEALGASENFSYARKSFTGMTDEVPYWNTATNNNLLWIGSATTTTEFVMNVENVGSVSFNLFTKGTTTVSSNTVTAVNWQLEFTQASSTTDGTWFSQDAETVTLASGVHRDKFHFYDS